MALDLDGFKVLRKIGEKPDAFACVAVEAKKAARTLLVKYVKAKSTDLTAVRSMRNALREDFDLFLEGMTDAELKAVGTKLDKNNADLRAASAAQRRAQIHSLASGTTEPVAKETKATRKKQTKPLSSLAIAAAARKG